MFKKVQLRFKSGTVEQRNERNSYTAIDFVGALWNIVRKPSEKKEKEKKKKERKKKEDRKTNGCQENGSVNAAKRREQ